MREGRALLRVASRAADKPQAHERRLEGYAHRADAVVPARGDHAGGGGAVRVGIGLVLRIFAGAALGFRVIVTIAKVVVYRGVRVGSQVWVGVF